MARGLGSFLALSLLMGAEAIGNGLIGIDLGHEFMKVSLVKPGMPFQIATNFESKRKTPSLMGFYKSERLFGSNAESIMARRPRHVFPAPQRTLGRNWTHPQIVNYANTSFIASELVANDRDGVSFVVPLEESGLDYLLTPEVSPSASATASASATEAAAAAATKASGIPFAAEELVGMLMAHARDFAQVFSGGPVMDAVITVPCYYTQNERLAILDAANLAGLKVLSLVDENTAAGIHYGIDRVFENSTHHMLLYNMGSEATQATLFAYDAYVTTEKGKNKTVGQARVLAKAWDTGLGGRHFDTALINYVAEKFNADKTKAAALPPSAKGDIRNVPAAMAKIRKNTVKAKEILSANEEYGASFEAVLPDVDFRVQLSRKILEEQAASLLARVTGPIESVLAQSGLSLSQIDVVEIVGGGVRMPKVQALLKDYLTTPAASATATGAASEATPAVNVNLLGQHLNGDEAMALGAAFLAANKSSSFRVRKVGMVDAYPWPIGVRLTQLNAASASTSTEGGEDASSDSAPTGKATKAWSKRSSLFKAYNSLDSVKRISFAGERDLKAVLFYEVTPKEGAAPLPEGTNRVLATYNITGVEALLAELAAKYNTTSTATPTPSASADASESPSASVSASSGPAPVVMVDPTTGASISGSPKVHISFELDDNGVARLLRAEATIEEDYVIFVTPTPVPTSATASTSGSGSASASGSTSGSASASESASPSSASATTSASASEDASARATTSASTDASGSASGSSSGSTSPSASVSPIAKNMRRTLRFPLTVTSDTRGALMVQPLAPSDVTSALVTVRRLAKADEEKKAREGAKNSLEAYIYASREKLATSDVEEALPSVTTEEQRDAIREGLMGAEDWLYDEGVSASVEVYRRKLRELRDVIEPVFFRLEETAARPQLVNDTVTFITEARALVAKWNTTHPQITANETADAHASINKFETWWNETSAKQAALAATEPPALTREGVGSRMKPVTDLLTRLARKPKPTPTPSPKADKKDKSSSSDKDSKKSGGGGKATPAKGGKGSGRGGSSPSKGGKGPKLPKFGGANTMSPEEAEELLAKLMAEQKARAAAAEEAEEEGAATTEADADAAVDADAEAPETTAGSAADDADSKDEL